MLFKAAIVLLAIWLLGMVRRLSGRQSTPCLPACRADARGRERVEHHVVARGLARRLPSTRSARVD